MKVIPLSKYLSQQARQGPASAVGAARLEQAALSQRSAADHARDIDAAHARGKQEGAEEAARELQLELKREQELFAVRLAELRQRWAADEAEKLSGALDQGLAKIEAEIAEAAARLIEPLLVDGARRSALDGLHAAIRAIWEQDAAVTFRVSGPKDVLEILEQRLEASVSIQFVPSGECEVRVEAGRAVIESTLHPWIAQVKEAAP